MCVITEFSTVQYFERNIVNIGQILATFLVQSLYNAM